MRISTVLFLFACALLIGGQAQAQFEDTEAAVTLTTPRTGVGAGTQTRGFTFTLDDPRLATHLGMFNYNGSGESNPGADRQIGVWDDGGTLVADLTIPGGPGGGIVDGDFIWGELASPVLLQADELYTAGVWYSVDNSPGLAFDFADVTGIDGFNYMDTVETGPPGGAFEKPTIVRDDRLNGYFGPNLRFSTAPLAVPEPASIAIWTLIGLGLTGFGYCRIRRQS